MILKQLIREIHDKEIQAPKRLYLHTHKHLYAVAIRYVHFDDVVKDVLQNTYVKIFKNLSKLEYVDEQSTLAWMKRICINEALIELRKKKNWNKLQVSDNSLIISSRHHLYGDEIYRALLKLPKQQRLAFNLFAIEGYKHKEIASLLDIQESNSRTLVGRARKFLASHITKEMIHETA